MGEEYEPRVLMIACNWCSYAAVDLAGTSRMRSPHNIEIIRVMCSGRVDPQFVLEAFARGADGVIVAGCRLGDCHYIEGNYKTLRRMILLKRMLEQMGIEPERFRLEWISAAEAKKYVQVAQETVNNLKKLGPLRVRFEKIDMIVREVRERE